MISFRALLRPFGFVLFSIGMLLAFFLTLLLVWADVEANSYGFPRVGNEPMQGLSCPAFLTTAENAVITVRVKNSTERALRTRVQAYISDPSLSRWYTETKPIETEPGQANTVTWELGKENVVLSYFVFFKAYTYASYPQPDSEGACGIFALNLPWISGRAVYWLWLGLSAACLLAGLWFSDFSITDVEQSSGRSLARKVLAVLAALGVLVGSAGWWPVGIILLIVMFIAFPAVLFYGETS